MSKPKPKATQWPRPTVGDQRWVVEWCVELGWVDDDDHDQGRDPDGNVMKSLWAESKEDAERIARKVYPQDQYGAVAYWPVEFVAYDEADAARYPHAGHWHATAEAETYEGEEGATP